MQIRAIIGASGSGKSDLALKIARNYGLEIFSIDSLSVYKYVDIASAKPAKSELREIKHYGIDLLEPSEKCSAGVFFELLKKCAHERLLIVGGSGFYLKSIIEGLSELPKIDKNTESRLKIIAQNSSAHELLEKIDINYAKKIHPNDKYRIQKALEIFFATHEKPSEFFIKNKRKKLGFKIEIFELEIEREKLRENISARVDKMLENGLIYEVESLYQKFPDSQIFKAIGLKEILWYLRGEISLESARELIIKNTNLLAKHQRTFNKTQFDRIFKGSAEEIERKLRY